MLYRGAEAIVTQENNCVVKQRIAKPYRHPYIDRWLRQERTDQEARILQKLARIRVPVPMVQEQREDTVVMEYVPGQLLKQVLHTESDYRMYAQQLGAILGQMHYHHVVHGDMTTSNMLIYTDTLYVIDCGLSTHSQRDEDTAMDLHVLKQSLLAAHYSIWQPFFEAVIARYMECYSDAERVLQRLERVEGRGRYK